jgi:3-phosphoshikimate 1-carboxyvinyltransferase
LKGPDVAGAEIPNLIDELPLVAAAGALAEGATVIRDAAELRVKESDRIAAMAHNLAALGVRVEEQPDGMRVLGRARIRGGAETDSAGDHRVAMAMAILAPIAEAPIRIRGGACIATSYPGFWDDLDRVTGS